ncbi:MAG: efflux RND transporter permease subunit [Myxococcaceae bacterium]
MKLTDVCIERPVFAWMLMAATVLFGVVAFSRIGISQFPDVDFPTINVNVSWEGAAPEVIEHDVVEPMEEAVTQVEGVKSIRSASRQGAASITVEFDLSRNVDLALQDVTAKISQAQRLLPRDIDPPVISKTNPEDQPIMWVGLSGPFSRQFLSDFARYQLKEKLQTVSGVGEVTLGGYVDRNVRIWVDADKLDEKQVTVGDIEKALSSEHIELPAGRLETEGREVNVRVMGEALDLDTFRHIVIRQVNGAPVYLSDVAMVEDGFDDVRRISRVNGEPAQGMGVRKQRGSNAVAVAEGVRNVIAELQKSAPEGLQIAIVFDSSKFIEESVHEIQLELLLSIVLTALVCWMFLGSFSSTLNVILAIPMSLLGTVAVIYFVGFTLNTFTLLGLSLAVGIVVDDAIMVLENIFRHAEMGKDRLRAAREGTAEITFAALAATLAVIAIFIPVIFMQGVVGKFFLQFGITLCVAVALSYLEAITLAPARAAQLVNAHTERGRLGKLVDRSFDSLAAVYKRVLGLGLRHPYVVLGAMVFVLVGAVFVFRDLPTEFVPSQDQSRISVKLQMAVGSSLDEASSLTERAENYLRSRPEVLSVFANVGGQQGAGVNQAQLMVTMKPPNQRKLTQEQFSNVIRKELNSYPGVRAGVQDLSQSGLTGQRGYPVEFSVRGPDWDELVKQTGLIREKLVASGAVTDLDSDYQLGMPELRIMPDRARSADVGISVEDVAQTVNALVGGTRVGKYSTGGRRVDVRMRLMKTQRTRPEDLSRLKVRNANGDLIPLSALVTTIEQPALQAVFRQERERAIGMFGNVASGHSQGEALKVVESMGKELPTGYRVVLSGASVAFRDSMTSLIFALCLGIMVAYMVLASQFNSFLHPITVLTILVPSVAGAAFALWLSGKSLNIFSMIGLLLLMGIVKKNSIILMDYALQMRAEGKDAVEAMLIAGPTRLRPILMTSIATMMAALPSSLSLGPGSETRAPMAIAVMGGLIVSTMLSLVVVPAFYVVADRLQFKVTGKHSKIPRHHATETQVS